MEGVGATAWDASYPFSRRDRNPTCPRSEPWGQGKGGSPLSGNPTTLSPSGEGTPPACPLPHLGQAGLEWECPLCHHYLAAFVFHLRLHLQVADAFKLLGFLFLMFCLYSFQGMLQDKCKSLPHFHYLKVLKKSIKDSIDLKETKQ